MARPVERERVTEGNPADAAGRWNVNRFGADLEDLAAQLGGHGVEVVARLAQLREKTLQLLAHAGPVELLDANEAACAAAEDEQQAVVFGEA